MHLDVVDLRRFYRTLLGLTARRQAGAQIRRFWPDVAGQDIALIGYATPYARFFQDERSMAGLMPAPQGVIPWPKPKARTRQNATALVYENALPVAEGAFDKVLLVHAIEPSEMLGGLIDEVWRILKPHGQVLAIVPNRHGAWASAEQTPFGTGRPFTRGQLAQLLHRHGFAVDGWSHALMMPPTSSRLMLRSANAWETVGRRLWPGFSGLVVMVATKEVLGMRGKRRAARFLQPVADLVPAPVPAPARETV